MGVKAETNTADVFLPLIGRTLRHKRQPRSRQTPGSGYLRRIGRTKGCLTMADRDQPGLRKFGHVK